MSLPQGWAAATVDDLGEYLNGMAFKPTDWGDEGIGIIRIQNLTNPSKPLNRTKRSFEERYRVTQGDLLVSWSATLDVFIWGREDSVLNQHIFKVTPSDCVDPQFLFYQLRELIAEMAASEHLHGSTMKHINRGPFLAHFAGLPPLAEQRRIVAKLDALTARLARARAELDRVQVLAEKLRNGALRAAFTTPAPTARVADIASRVTKGSSPGWQGYEYQSDGVLFVRSQNVRWGSLALDEQVFLPPAFNQKARNSVIRKGDILLNIVGASIGRAAVATAELGGANCNQAVHHPALGSRRCKVRHALPYLT